MMMEISMNHLQRTDLVVMERLAMTRMAEVVIRMIQKSKK